MIETGRKIGVFVLGGIIALLLLEGGLRVQHFLKQNRIERHSPGAMRTILCVGDSFVYGIGASREKSFPSQLQQLLGQNYAVINMGLGGQNTADVLGGLRSHIQTVNPDVVVILCGGNNMWNLRGSDNYLHTKSRWAHMCDWLSGIRTARFVKLLIITLKDKSGRALPPKQVPESEMKGRTKKEAEYGRRSRSASKPKKAWRKFPNYTECTDAEIAALREGYEKGIRSAPADTGNYQGLGMLCLARREYESSIRCFRTAIQKDPEESRNYIELARVYDEMGRNDEAVTCVHKALEIDPDESSAYERLGHVYIHMSRYSDALRAFRKSLEIIPAEDEHRYSGIVLISREAQDEETRREAGRLLHEYQQNKKDASSSLMRLIFEENNIRDPKIREWIQGDIGEMIGICRERHAGIIILNYPSDSEKINRILRDIATSHSLPFVNNEAVLRRMLEKGEGCRIDYYAPDGHCNAKGYGVMAKNVYNTMIQNGYIDKHE